MKGKIVLTDIAYWIAFGAHGPRKETPKGEGWKIASKVVQLVAVSVAVFYSTRIFAKPPPRTMTKEWQEASNEYALVRLFSLSLFPDWQTANNTQLIEREH
jgi:Cytochrome c oxidase subunit IV